MSFFTGSLGAESKILAFSGSTRKASLNKKLIHAAANMAREKGVSVEVIDFSELQIPWHDGDLEQRSGMPDNAKMLRRLMLKSDAIIIASPNYNGSLPGVLKNALDWASRTEDG